MELLSALLRELPRRRRRQFLADLFEARDASLQAFVDRQHRIGLSGLTGERRAMAERHAPKVLAGSAKCSACIAEGDGSDYADDIWPCHPFFEATG